MIAARVLSLAIGYGCGLFETGYFYGKKKGVDIRTRGSGNSGATNTLRTFGAKAGLITCIGDMLKAAAAVFLSWLIFHRAYAEHVILLELYAGFGAVLGHDFPCYLGFKGGKGVASTSGTALSIFPIVAPVSLALFLLAVFVTRYVSLGSILAFLSLSVQVVLFGQLGMIAIPADARMEFYILTVCFSALGIWRHRANIGRLLRGTENKISIRGK